MEFGPLDLALAKGIVFTEKLRCTYELSDIIKQLRESRLQAGNDRDLAARENAQADATELDSILGTILRKEVSIHEH
jgi:hypothetical protein